MSAVGPPVGDKSWTHVSAELWFTVSKNDYKGKQVPKIILKTPTKVNVKIIERKSCPMVTLLLEQMLNIMNLRIMNLRMMLRKMNLLRRADWIDLYLGLVVLVGF